MKRITGNDGLVLFEELNVSKGIQMKTVSNIAESPRYDERFLKLVGKIIKNPKKDSINQLDLRKNNSILNKKTNMACKKPHSV